jgi:predicted ATP-grasp superfamily ATP-dependent carboligase
VRVLIVDEGRERSAVVAARALAGAGWTVGAGSSEPNLAARTNAVTAWHHIEHVAQTDEVFLASIEDVVKTGGYEGVFVCWEQAVSSLSANRDRLSFPVGYGPHAGLVRAMDKELLMQTAQDVGLGVPRTVPATAEAIAELSGPIVIKPASPVDASVQAVICEDHDSALRQALVVEQSGGRAIAQEQLRGELIAVSLVAGESGIVSISQQRAVHTWPNPVGVTARGVTVPIDPQLRAGVERLLADLRWQGLAQLQFLLGEDGEPRLLDFNPRYYGSLALAVRAGANHPDVWARLTTGRPVAASTGRPGASYQWFTRDLRATLAAPDRTREAARFGYTALTGAHSLWSWREPGLAPKFLLEQAGRALAKRRPGVSLPNLDRGSRSNDDATRSAMLNQLPPIPNVLDALRTRRVPTRPERVLQRVQMKRGTMSYERSWLEPLHAATQEALGAGSSVPPRLLVRVDEFPYYSGFDDARFGLEASRRFQAVMAEERVPHLMSVLPQWTHDALDPGASGGRPLDDDDRALLAQMSAEGVTFAQHGNTHRTRHANPRRHSELSGLSPVALGELLDEGKRKLADVGVHPRILVPPFNRFDAKQWAVLEQRYDVVTGGPESVMLMGFHGGPQWRGEAIYLPCYAPLYESARVVEQAVETLLASGVGGWIPIVLHMGWEVDDNFAALRALARRIAPFTASWEDLLASADASRTA